MTVLDSPSPPGSDISEIGLISADSHVNEPRDLWSSNLPPSLRSQAMQGIESGEDGSWKVVFEGQHVFKREMAAEADRLAVLDPAEALRRVAGGGHRRRIHLPDDRAVRLAARGPEGRAGELPRLQRVDLRHVAEQVRALLLCRASSRCGNRSRRRSRSSGSRRWGSGRSCCRRTPRSPGTTGSGTRCGTRSTRPGCRW